MEVKQIHIKHPALGEIIVNGLIEKEINEQIGDISDDFSKYPQYYHAKISKNEDGTFYIQNFGVIKPEGINVGFMDNSKGSKTFVTIITNRKAGDDIMIYPSAIMSVTYK